MTTNDIAPKMILDRWQGALKNFDSVLESISDERLLHEITPGKNRGIYLLGHMIAVHDDMLILLDMGDKLYPELQMPFIASPDKTVKEIPSAAELRGFWKKQCEVLNERFEKLSAADWYERHTAVPAEEFANEPHRNKLNILLTRTTHMTYHTGQLVLLTVK